MEDRHGLGCPKEVVTSTGFLCKGKEGGKPLSPSPHPRMAGLQTWGVTGVTGLETSKGLAGLLEVERTSLRSQPRHQRTRAERSFHASERDGEDSELSGSKRALGARCCVLHRSRVRRAWLARGAPSCPAGRGAASARQLLPHSTAFGPKRLPALPCPAPSPAPTTGASAFAPCTWAHLGDLAGGPRKGFISDSGQCRRCHLPPPTTARAQLVPILAVTFAVLRSALLWKLEPSVFPSSLPSQPLWLSYGPASVVSPSHQHYYCGIRVISHESSDKMMVFCCSLVPRLLRFPFSLQMHSLLSVP